MFRFWRIRLPFLLALISIAYVWFSSYFDDIGLYKWQSGRVWRFDVIQGRIRLWENKIVDAPLAPLPDSSLMFHQEKITNHPINVSTTFGFYFGADRGLPHSFMIIFPIWLPTLALAGLCFLAWWKLQRVESGFPVEMESKKTEKI